MRYKNDRSEVVSSEYFLSENGPRSPLDELKATIEAFSSTEESADNSHAICRFPWRRRIIEEGLGMQFRDMTCSSYEEWKSENNATSISLLFATGYLNNPASHYGHILLKFNSKKHYENDLNMLDSSINFGAIGTQHDGIIAYIVKGLLGGYEAAFSDQKFYRHNLAYGETQLRDIWEYELDLNQNQVAAIVDHTWELLPHKFQYYFLKENCAYRMAELIELVVDREMISKTYPFAIPYSVFDRAARDNSRQERLVREIRYIPSRQRRLSLRMAELSSAEKNIIQQLIRNNFSLDKTDYHHLENVRKAVILEVMLDYYQFLGAKEKDPDYKLDIKNRVYRERLQLPANLAVWNTQSSTPPHLGTRPSTVRFSLKSNESGNGFALRYRPAYYDFLTPDYAIPPNSQLVVMEIGLEYMDNSLQLEKLDLLDIKALNTSFSGLPEDGGFAWQFYLGYRDLISGCQGCKTYKALAGLGWGHTRSMYTGFAMVNARTHRSWRGSGSVSGQAEIGSIIEVSRHVKIFASITRDFYLNEFDANQLGYTLESRFFNKKSWDFRLKIEKGYSTTGELSASWYF